MALRRFDRTLAGCGVAPMVCVGRPFDPTVMRAVGKRWMPEKPEHNVLEEQLGGFIHNGGTVLRYAEVVVNAKEDEGVF